MDRAVPQSRRRVWIFVAFTSLCLAAGAGYVAWAVLRVPAAASSSATPSGSPTIVPPRLVFQNVARDYGYAHVATARLRAPNGPRAITRLVCERVHFAAGRGLCLIPKLSPLGETYLAKIFGPDGKPVREVVLNGAPSRARVSPDGRYGAATVFVFGHSYADEGGFSTQTTLIDMASGEVLGALESFTVTRDGERIHARDFNFWGVTFARDSNRFYATLGTGGKRYLVEGDVAGRRLRVLHERVECPSLSPDGTRIAYKRWVDMRHGWRLSTLDLNTMTETPLAETRSVDDQVEWLDGRRLLYGLRGNLWIVPADGTGKPRLFVADALSPAVVR